MKNYSIRTFGVQAVISDRALREARHDPVRLARNALRRELARGHRIVKTQPVIDSERDILRRISTFTISAECWTRQSRAHHPRRRH